MRTFNFSANSIDFGDYVGDTQDQAQDAFATDAGYADWADMVARVTDDFGINAIEIREKTELNND